MVPFEQVGKLKVVIALNAAWNIVNFRAGLVKHLLDAGHEVVAVAPPDAYVDRLKALGVRYVPLHMDTQGTNPLSDLMLCFRFYGLLRRERPDVYLSYTVKPNVYGSLAAHALRVPVVNNIAGLGSVFSKDNWLTKLVKGLYRLSLKHSAKVFFQNEDDREAFIAAGIVRAEITDRLPGSGVDLQRFKQAPMPPRNDLGSFRFLLVARMLWEKGVGEYVQAARELKKQHPQIEFALLGFLDVENPEAISRSQMDEWVQEGVVTYLGVSDQVEREIAAAHCVVLPSFYREGVPRTLLEAAAIGRPIITTDAIGCREVVDDGKNGYLCQPRDSSSLAQQMSRLLELGNSELDQMGKASRQKAEAVFDEKIVISKYEKILNEMDSKP